MQRQGDNYTPEIRVQIQDFGNCQAGSSLNWHMRNHKVLKTQYKFRTLDSSDGVRPNGRNASARNEHGTPAYRDPGKTYSWIRYAQ